MSSFVLRLKGVSSRKDYKVYLEIWTHPYSQVRDVRPTQWKEWAASVFHPRGGRVAGRRKSLGSSLHPLPCSCPGTCAEPPVLPLPVFSAVYRTTPCVHSIVVVGYPVDVRVSVRGPLSVRRGLRATPRHLSPSSTVPSSVSVRRRCLCSSAVFGETVRTRGGPSSEVFLRFPACLLGLSSYHSSGPTSVLVGLTGFPVPSPTVPGSDVRGFTFLTLEVEVEVDPSRHSRGGWSDTCPDVGPVILEVGPYRPLVLAKSLWSRSG